MLAVLANSLAGVGLVLAVAVGLFSYLSRPPPLVLTAAVGVLAAAVVVQAVIAVALLISGERAEEQATFIGYLLFSVLVLPAAFAWARAEPGRWGSGVLAVGCLTLSVMIVRMGQLWGIGGG